MAQYVPRNKVTRFLTQYKPNKAVENVVSLASKFSRAAILLSRETRGFQKNDNNGPPGAFKTSGLAIFETEKLAREKKFRESRGASGRFQIEDPSGYTHENFTPETRTALKDSISLVDISSSPYRSITLPFIPREVSYDPQSKFIGIATIGRNNPFYHYTGSEDVLQFDIEWYSMTKEDLDRRNVINSCRWVEALTKASGYSTSPPIVKLVWGQDDLLWAEDEWIVASAPYKLGDFVKGYKDPDTGQIKRIGLMPQQATQSITLKRVTKGNTSRDKILGNLQKI